MMEWNIQFSICVVNRNEEKRTSVYSSHQLMLLLAGRRPGGRSVCSVGADWVGCSAGLVWLMGGADWMGGGLGSGRIALKFKHCSLAWSCRYIQGDPLFSYTQELIMSTKSNTENVLKSSSCLRVDSRFRITTMRFDLSPKSMKS